MSEEMTRKEVIWQLKGLLISELRTTTKERKALEYAISSLETDEAYQLEYEMITKPTIEEFIEYAQKEFGVTLKAVKSDNPDTFEKLFKPTIKEKLNGCRGLRENLIEDIRNIYMSAHAHIEVEEVINKYIPSEYSITNNDSGVDCIVDVLGSYTDLDIPYKREIAENILTKLSSVTPQEHQSFKWCTDCKEYNQKKHCCHRYSEVIRDAVAEISQKPKTGHWIKVTNGRGGHECDVCHDYAPSFQNGNEYLSTFCPNCGCAMVEPQESEDNNA